jgi:hypothetical protein
MSKKVIIFSRPSSARNFADKVNGDAEQFTTDSGKARFKVEFTAKEEKSQKSNKYDDYSEQWNEKNLDGSFAYNGVTDDF